ncbi:MAG: tail fiber domain-containing protein [Bacteroidales bacterium]
MAKKVNGVVHNMYNNATDSGGYAIPPLATNLALGQLVVNTSESDPCVLFKTSAGKIVKIVSEEVITKALTDILGNSAADLDTLRELIAQFEGSANDILPLLVALTDRVTAAETALGNKANSSVVNAHISNTSNPHGVTAAQVGLSNVRNVEQLGKTETAADSSKLGGSDASAYVGFKGITLDANDMPYNSTGFTYALNAPNSGSITSLGHDGYQMQFSSHYAVSGLSFRTHNGDKRKWNPWVEIYTNSNSNKSDINWTCRELTANHHIQAIYQGYISRFNQNLGYTWITNVKLTGTTETNEGQIKLGKDVFDYNGNAVYHAGNSNKSDVNWVCNNLKVNGNAGFGTNNPTDRVHAVGNVRATEKGIFGGNVESNGSGIFAGDILAKKSGAVVFAANDQSGGSATRLNDLQDVKLPANLTAKMIMAYDPAQINSDGTTGGYTFMPAVGVGTGKVVADDIESLPDITLEGSPYAAVSDKRLKENIRPLIGATNILLNFAAKEYEWSDEGRKLGLTDPRAYGLIAQEAAELKDIVDIVRPLGISDYLGVDYIKIVPILIAGFQEQHKEIVDLNRLLQSIKTRANKAFGTEGANAKKIETLESEVAELKRLMSN